MRLILLMGLFLLMSGCATIHHIQLGDINSPLGYTKVPIEVKVSETGVDIKEIENLMRSSRSKEGDRAGDALEALQMFQMGPRTGAPVYSDKYAEMVLEDLLKQCPTGLITGLNSIRESREYPVIKGEIVKIKAYCLRRRS